MAWGVVILHVLRDRQDEIVNGMEDTATKTTFRDIAKETFDHIEPGSAGGSEMNMKSFIAFHPYRRSDRRYTSGLLRERHLLTADIVRSWQ